MDWERLEAELAAGPSLADRIVATARRQRACRSVSVAVVATLLTAALAAPVLLVALHHRPAAAPPRQLARPMVTPQPEANTQASIYVAALTDGRRPHRLSQRIWVSSRRCDAIPVMPSPAKCADRVIPASVRRQVVAELGPALRFAARPPTPHRASDAPVIQFGRLVVHGDNARLGVETLCGPVCAQGLTLVLRRHDGRWQIAGSVGPRWVS